MVNLLVEFAWTLREVLMPRVATDCKLSGAPTPGNVMVNLLVEFAWTLREVPSTVLTKPSASKLYSSESTWYRRISVSAFLFWGFNKLPSTPSGSAAKASLVGAKTVNVPGELSVSTKSAAITACTSVESSGVACASSTMLAAVHADARETKRTDFMMLV